MSGGELAQHLQCEVMWVGCFFMKTAGEAVPATIGKNK